MSEKDFIPGTNPAWGRELPDNDLNSLVDKNGNSYDDGYHFVEKDDDPDTENSTENDYPDFDPESARQRYNSDKD